MLRQKLLALAIAAPLTGCFTVAGTAIGEWTAPDTHAERTRPGMSRAAKGAAIGAALDLALIILSMYAVTKTSE